MSSNERKKERAAGERVARYLDLWRTAFQFAEGLAAKSSALAGGVAAVLFSPDLRYIYAIGMNGKAPDVIDFMEANDPRDSDRSSGDLHAEQNLFNRLPWAARPWMAPPKGSLVLAVTRPPCSRCCHLIASHTAIGAVITGKPGATMPGEHFLSVREIDARLRQDVDNISFACKLFGNLDTAFMIPEVTDVSAGDPRVASAIATTLAAWQQ